MYENDNIVVSESFDIEIQESGTYKIIVTGEKTKGSVSFEKIAGEETERKEVSETTIDLSEAFRGVNGCAVIYSPVQEEYSFFNEDMCRQEESPYSTFKIISALSGLQNGIIVDELSTMGYDGTDYGNLEWNEDLTLEEAFQKSCIWYFRKVIDSIGKDKIQEELNGLQYGNCDISEWNGSNINPMEMLNGFWLDSSLKISPVEQVEVLSRIFEGYSYYDSRNIEILKRIMLVEETDSQKIYGKTGSGNGEAWFVGFSESNEERKYFAIYLNDSEQKERVSRKIAKEIALEIMK
ncbi:class D beta-lactamase [[Clostridium] scindens]|nr:class D beta-lactamase [[Clostridium] scindens]NSJ05229.1 class D beta-lactamase [[Clostridium] scindens]